MKRLVILGMVVVMVAIAAMPAAAMATNRSFWLFDPDDFRESIRESGRFEHSAKKEYNNNVAVCFKKGKTTLYLPHIAAKKLVGKHDFKWGRC
jgi:hypothetical protein